MSQMMHIIARMHTLDGRLFVLYAPSIYLLSCREQLSFSIGLLSSCIEWCPGWLAVRVRYVP